MHEPTIHPDPVPLADQSVRRVLADAIRTAPAKVRRSLIAGVLVVVLAMVMSVGDALTGTDELELLRLAAVVIASLGYVILLTARVLHTVSQQGW